MEFFSGLEFSDGALDLPVAHLTDTRAEDEGRIEFRALILAHHPRWWLEEVAVLQWVACPLDDDIIAISAAIKIRPVAKEPVAQCQGNVVERIVEDRVRKR